MERLLIKAIVSLLLLSVLVKSNLLLNIGNKCSLENGRPGICSAFDECNYAADLLKQGKRPINCGFVGNEPIVCCTKNLNIAKNIYGERSKQECIKIGQSDDKGVPREPVHALAGGEPTELGEYPHMVRLGVGQNVNNIEWYCGGSLISETFILTAAHCIHSRYGTINWARFGEATNFSAYEYIEVIRNVIHPNYNHTLYYNDIAISEVAKKPEYSFLVGPACLHGEREIPTYFSLTVTGWGSDEFGGEGTKELLKAAVSLFSYEECRGKYSSNIRKLPNGIVNDTQICAGGKDVVKDSCQGDSGGPLQIPNCSFSLYKKISRVVGVTSFGKVCGFKNQPGVYVRVYPYIPWIEQVVWNT